MFMKNATPRAEILRQPNDDGAQAYGISIWDPIIALFPARPAGETGWQGHLPFAFWIVKALKPRVFVELGTQMGHSYCAFCQAVSHLGLGTACYAVDTWRGDDHTGYYSEHVFNSLSQYHNPRYGKFSQLIRATFDEAVSHFKNGSVDLLHIDGLHRYESVRHDFETWLPKLSDRAVVLFHDTAITHSDFGVWRYWEELSAQYPHFSFLHSNGLGVLGVGKDLPPALLRLFNTKDEESVEHIRSMFMFFGSKFYPNFTPEEPAVYSLRFFKKALRLAGLIAKQVLENPRLARKFAALVWNFLRHGDRRSLVIAAKKGATDGGASSMSYRDWILAFDTMDPERLEALRHEASSLANPPVLSILMPVYNPSRRWLQRAMESVRAQVYTNWELCIADDASTEAHVRPVLEEYEQKDPRIKVVYRKTNGHISSAFNSALALASGAYCALLDHDDEIPEHALLSLVKEINAHPDVELIYSDEDKIDDTGRRFDPYFKPDWNPDLLLAQNFICHLTAYRTERLRSIGGFREGFEGSQDYDLVLRYSETIREAQIRHIPQVLYHRRAAGESTAVQVSAKGDAPKAALRAVQEHLSRKGIAASVEPAPNAEIFQRVRYRLPMPPPLVSILIPSRDGLDILRRCVDSIYAKTRYPKFEVIIVDNNSAEPGTLAYLKELTDRGRARVVRYPLPFNYSAINNFAVGKSKGEVLCLLNNDTEVISGDWLEEMVSQAVRPEIGAVGAKLYYPDDSIQHAGVVLGIGPGAGHSHRNFHRTSAGDHHRLLLVQNFSAVTAACMVLRRSVYEQVGGMDEENLPIAYNDVALCLRLREAGYRNLWTPYAELYHHESKTRGHDDTPEKAQRARRESYYMQEIWGNLLRNDPAYNPNLTLDREDFSLAAPPRTPNPKIFLASPGEPIPSGSGATAPLAKESPARSAP